LRVFVMLDVAAHRCGAHARVRARLRAHVRARVRARASPPRT
jgi:D-serine deaminase-like pyridoxal phosphate-dependent protein